jgi:hypothetical protein
MTIRSESAIKTTVIQSAPTILIITSSGGGGHLQAAKAEHIRVLEKYPKAKIIQQDVLLDWAGKFGKFCRYKWNRAQQRGDILELERLINLQPLAEILLFIPIFISMFRLLMKENIDQIIDTQPVGTAAIIKAIKISGYILKKNLILEKMITELPTEAACHFFSPIKNLKSGDKKLIRITTTYPLIGENETEDHFWEKHCGIDKSIVYYENFPLRPSFVKYDKKIQIKEPLELFIPLPDPLEMGIVTNTLQKGSAYFQKKEGGLLLSIDSTDKVSVLMLGSQPEQKALLRYIGNFIQISKEKKYRYRRDLLFVFCSDFLKEDSSIQKKIRNLVCNDPDYPQSLTIFPLSFQEDDVIAPLFSRSDATFTKSGGLTSMEILTVCKGKIWIHKSDPVKKFRLLGSSKHNNFGMPRWENGNALYLKAKKGADFITPDTFQSVSTSFFAS